MRLVQDSISDSDSEMVSCTRSILRVLQPICFVFLIFCFSEIQIGMVAGWFLILFNGGICGKPSLLQSEQHGCLGLLCVCLC